MGLGLLNIVPIFAKKVFCTVDSIVWLTPDVFRIRFVPNKKFEYEAGQFISIYSPSRDGTKPVRRAYSLSSSCAEDGYELMITRVEGGVASNYMASLKPGDHFEATAPYGEFRYDSPPDRKICFIATGTGIAPLLSIARSDSFQPEQRPLLIFGARSENDLLCSDYFESVGFKTKYCLSRQPGPFDHAFHGRITDFLRSLPASWPFHMTDFYLCGNGGMINEVTDLLLSERGVPRSAVFTEIFFNAHSQVAPSKNAA